MVFEKQKLLLLHTPGSFWYNILIDPDLQNQIFRALPDPPDEALSPTEIADGTVTLEDLQGQLEAVRAELPDVSHLPALAAMASAAAIMDSDALFFLMLMHAEAQAGNYSPGIEGFLDRMSENISWQRRENLRASRVGDWDLVLVYFRQIWEDKATAIMAQLAGVSRSTAQGWVRGRRPSRKHRLLVFAAGHVCYTLHEERDMTAKEVRHFFETPLEGQVPLDIWSQESVVGQAPARVRRFLEQRP